jgi:hypothetical protein
MVRRAAWVSLSLICAAEPAAAADTASIVLRGYVPIFNAIELQNVSTVIANDLRSPVRDALVAKILERSNSPSGYTIKLISENGAHGTSAALRNDQGSSVPYRLSYGGQPVRFTNGRAEISRSRSPRSERSREEELRISADGSDRLTTGEYSDTLIIAVTAR